MIYMREFISFVHSDGVKNFLKEYSYLYASAFSRDFVIEIEKIMKIFFHKIGIGIPTHSEIISPHCDDGHNMTDILIFKIFCALNLYKMLIQ